MNQSHLKMIAFDVFGVLITEGHLISNGLMHLLPDNTERSIVKQNYEKYNIGAISEEIFWKNIGHNDYAELRHEFLKLFTLDPDFSVVQTLKRDYQLAILSNFPPDWASNFIHRFGFSELFDPIIFSGFMECKKPQADIYQMLIQNSGLAVSQIAFVDDRLENLQTAHDLGMTTIHYQRENDVHNYRADITIQNLAEINAFMID